MNTATANFSIPTLLRLLTVALAVAGWNLTQRMTRRAIKIGDWILRMVGWATIVLAHLALNIGLWLHIRLTSRIAMRRYKRWTLATARAIKRWSIATYRFVDHYTTLGCDWMMHAFYLRGSIGLVNFDIDDEDRDGYVVVRQFGDQRNVGFNFRIENRWIARKGFHGRAMTELRTCVMDAGHNITRVVVGEQPMMPHAKLPEISLSDDCNWKPGDPLPDYRRHTANDILFRVA
jgi:hypothetical protein